ncbi:hypothetical protein MDOR_24840 [Mycolicibacterium doricum]|uniref:FAD dependent oxidoreductase domain-containing protein n=1 Tax=Mycolicibacterium doricum TaxID=126673 RepID=A0A1X1T6V9_9MYCO|nr:hypothetical protein AWC01_12355 [Mycolicibacterium doricum]BBZ08315.1 hypothetical protein MDOR_24840 [Mycolicibacterium doricum]
MVVGGGITGAGIALDAASRGLAVVLVGKRDLGFGNLGFGTSRWSSKLLHADRYLASGNRGIARRSSVERGTLMTRTTRPHLPLAHRRGAPGPIPDVPQPSRQEVSVLLTSSTPRSRRPRPKASKAHTPGCAR